MNVIIDTSSLLALVRNYLPFDQNNKLKSLIQKKFENRSLIIIDKVYNESRDLKSKIIFKNLDFIESVSRSKIPKGVVATDNILPKRKFYNQLENEFCNQDVRRNTGITEAEFETEKEKFLNLADAKMILFAQNLIGNDQLGNNLFNTPTNIIIVTEESAYSNDGKYFKKIPAICKILGIECCTLPELFKNHYCLNLGELLS